MFTFQQLPLHTSVSVTAYTHNTNPTAQSIFHPARNSLFCLNTGLFPQKSVVRPYTGPNQSSESYYVDLPVSGPLRRVISPEKTSVVRTLVSSLTQSWKPMKIRVRVREGGNEEKSDWTKQSAAERTESLARPLTGYIILGKLCSLSGPQFSPL